MRNKRPATAEPSLTLVTMSVVLAVSVVMLLLKLVNILACKLENTAAPTTLWNSSSVSDPKVTRPGARSVLAGVLLALIYTPCVQMPG